MGREDSHYRPDGGAGRPPGGSASGGFTGRVPVPDAHPARRGSGTADVTPAGTAPGGDGRPAPVDLWAAAAARPAAGPPPVSAPPSPPTAPGRRRRLLPVALATVLVLVLAAVGLAVVRPGPVGQWLGDEPAAPSAAARPPEPAPVPVLAAADANAPLPTTAGVRAALAPLVGVSALGDRVNVSVADVATGRPLYGRGEDDGTVPASVTKLVTAVTVLAARGPGYRIPTRAVAGAAPGEVVLVGGGDPTLAVDRKGFYPGAARLDDLAAQVKKALGGTAPTKVVVDSTLYSGPVHEPGWDSDIPDGGYGGAVTALMTDGARSDVPQAKKDHDNGNHGADRVAKPDVAAGRSFARLLGVPADRVTTGRAPAAGAGAAAGAPGTQLGVVSSLPMVRLVDIMISDSDNLVAEALARQVALARGEAASFAGGAKAMDAVVAELGLPADEMSLADGSGLSRSNRISPSLLTDLITLAGDGTRPELAAIFGGLPVAAWSGTLTDRFAGPAGVAAGQVRAKTGTLTRVHAIAGLVSTADGRLLSFAVLTDDVPPDGLTAARAALDRVTAALATCGCR
ncbi:D-alanyl-D-alanine carboxypeptidase/D-alanyl-D-alanine-endopeptidase [Micromonospora endolithica]|uniref:D-alanyl-D-alanine carboxypeptidase/D-alanyl-D-alanine-endopeptidase n=1 Tax=Micromonospora endolithica TaxID=230091 RepID=A0A3A9Z618_9ACTN|nr:D-alanyl-D-alanine carboxypeptidase/D-alanyl-D-alanine-endopeptidase [Micromonospora endolithica]TWJ25419.1 D-alanyl-D-alanine carboxypeptidase/D-alanyl-D-alanine-endopeptidase (penicillin-binding protein 4) [Micromonospora endolithica]